MINNIVLLGLSSGPVKNTGPNPAPIQANGNNPVDFNSARLDPLLGRGLSSLFYLA